MVIIMDIVISVSSGSVTCDLLTQLDDSSVCSLNSSQVDTIDIDMLTDCPTSLGQVNGCDETWCELLYNRAVAVSEVKSPRGGLEYF